MSYLKHKSYDKESYLPEKLKKKIFKIKAASAKKPPIGHPFLWTLNIQKSG